VATARLPVTLLSAYSHFLSFGFFHWGSAQSTDLGYVQLIFGEPSQDFTVTFSSKKKLVGLAPSVLVCSLFLFSSFLFFVHD